MTDLDSPLRESSGLSESEKSEIIEKFGERGKKALRILDAGKIIQYRDFLVVSGSGGEYVVEGDLCTCGDFLFRKRECSHILAVTIAKKTGCFIENDGWYQDILREGKPISTSRKKP